MPRNGPMTLSDVRSPTLGIACEACAPRGRCNVERLMAERGDTKLTDGPRLPRRATTVRNSAREGIESSA